MRPPSAGSRCPADRIVIIAPPESVVKRTVPPAMAGRRDRLIESAWAAAVLRCQALREVTVVKAIFRFQQAIRVDAEKHTSAVDQAALRRGNRIVGGPRAALRRDRDVEGCIDAVLGQHIDQRTEGGDVVGREVASAWRPTSPCCQMTCVTRVTRRQALEGSEQHVVQLPVSAFKGHRHAADAGATTMTLR